jgi:hypothetical protein
LCEIITDHFSSYLFLESQRHSKSGPSASGAR